MSRKADDNVGGSLIPAKSQVVEEYNDRMSRVAKVKPLIFFEIDEETGDRKPLDPRTERRRQQIWDLYFGKSLDIKKIKELTKASAQTIKCDIEICTERYNDWIDKFGLDIFGTPNQRLRSHIEELMQLLDDVKKTIATNIEDEMPAELRNNRKLQLDILREISKFKGIEPPKEMLVDVTLSLAQESRRKMEEAFP